MYYRFLLLLLLVLCSCSFKTAQKLPLFGSSLAIEKSHLLTAELKSQTIKSYRSLLRVQQEYDRQKASFRQAVAYQAENYLLLEAFRLIHFLP